MQSLNVVFTGKDQVEVVREEVKPVEPHTVLIRTHRTLISTGTEGICLGRKFAPGTNWERWVQYPFYPGYSSVGTIIEVGEGARNFQVGQRVAARAQHRQFALVAADNVYPLSDAISDESACWVAFASIVQGGARRPKIEMGESVVVIGLGMLGQLAVQYARVAGAGEVVAIDTAPKRLEMAKAHGASRVLAMGVEDALPHIREITDGHGADVVFDVTGHAPVFQHAIGLLRRFGRLVILGDTGTPGEQRLTHDVINNNLQILGTHDRNAPDVGSDFARWDRREMVALFFQYVERGQMRVDDLITHTYSPHDAPAAYQMLQTDRSEVMGVTFDFSALDA